jgi:hypothetical protein
MAGRLTTHRAMIPAMMAGRLTKLQLLVGICGHGGCARLRPRGRRWGLRAWGLGARRSARWQNKATVDAYTKDIRSSRDLARLLMSKCWRLFRPNTNDRNQLARNEILGNLSVRRQTVQGRSPNGPRLVTRLDK